MTAAEVVTHEQVVSVLCRMEDGKTTVEDANLMRAYLQSLYGRIEMLERMIDDGG